MISSAWASGFDSDESELELDESELELDESECRQLDPTEEVGLSPNLKPFDAWK